MRREPATVVFWIAEDRYVSHCEPKPASSAELWIVFGTWSWQCTGLWL